MAAKYKCRISEFAKDEGISAKEVIAELSKSGISGKTASSGLTENDVKELKKKFAPANKENAVKKEVSSKKSPAKKKTPAPKKKPVVVVEKISETEIPEKKETAAPETAKKARKSASKYVKKVHELAKELGVASATLIEKISALGISGKKPSSGITEEEYNLIRGKFFGEEKKKKAAETREQKRKEKVKKPEEAPPPPPPPPPKKTIKIDVTTTVSSLAEKLKMSSGTLIKKLIKQGIITTINQRLDFDTASLIIQEEGFEPEIVDIYEDALEKSDDRDITRAVKRPPVITIMGHVDHGKTSLLDYIRKSHITQKEFGNITQHIGAYQVKHGDKKITFIDTPGHEAFTAMRLRGAQVTDIVVLVVDACDGVMPQTREAISHARLAGVPIIVAMNKMDLSHANPEKVKQQLSQENLLPEEWGGKTIIVPISAKTGKGVPDLLDMIELQAEMLDIKADILCRGRGVVLDAKLDPSRGPIATIIVTDGKIKVGEPFVCGFSGGKVRAILLEGGKTAREVMPGTPVEIMGFTSLPEVGDKFSVIEDAGMSRNILASRKKIKDKMRLKPAQSPVEGGADEKAVKIIIKADVMGSLEAIKDALSKLSNPEVTLTIVHSGCGGINRSDVLLAQASNSRIIGFNVRGGEKIDAVAQEKGVEVRTYTIIYELIADIKKALEGQLSPIYNEISSGRAEVIQIFTISKIGTVAGCIVKAGALKQKARVRLLRDNNIVYTGNLLTLKRFKDDVQEVTEGMECGLMLDKYNDIKPADIVESYELQKVQRALDDGKSGE